jgi:hypothetical protein
MSPEIFLLLIAGAFCAGVFFERHNANEENERD